MPFSPERIDQALATFDAYWRGERTGPLLSVHAEPACRQMLTGNRVDLDAIADAAAAVIEADAASGDPHVLPTVYADFGTISTARLFGGRPVYPRDGGNIHIETIAHSIDDLAGLSCMPFEESDFQVAVDLWKRVCDRLGTDRVFLRTPDFQGPMNTLALIMEQTTLMMAMYDDPDAVHAALATVTDALIAAHEWLRRQVGAERIVGNIWPYTYLPGTMGTSITQDMMPLLSAELYRDFEIPQLRRIADALGGLMIHCCGKYAQHLPALRDSGLPILGLEFHYPFTPFAEVYRHFGDSIVYVSYLFSENKDFPDYLTYARHLLAEAPPETRLWFTTCVPWYDAGVLRKLIDEQS